MPLYEFECKNCGERFEEFKNWESAENDVVCPKCGSREIKKLLFSFGIGDFSDLDSCGNESFG